MAHNLELTYTRPNTSVAWHTVPEEIIDIIIAWEDSGKLISSSESAGEGTVLTKTFSFDNIDSLNELMNTASIASQITARNTYNDANGITLDSATS